MITVVAALIKKDNKYLIAKRKTGDINVINKWEFPGGKVELNENEKQAIEREMKEEFDMNVKAIKFLVNNVCEYPSKTIDLRLYECDYVKGKFKLNDHSDYVFVSKEDLLNYDLCPADIPIAKFIKEMEYERNI